MIDSPLQRTGQAMIPVIGSTWGLSPERLTLTEARKREAGKALWERVTRYFTALKSFGGSNG